MKKLLLIILLCILSLGNIQAQPIAKADAIISLETILLSNVNMINPAEDLYDDVWDHKNVHCYKSLPIEHDYDINIKEFCMPINKEKIRINSNYGYRKQYRRNHYGIDLNLHTGDTIYATFSGKIRISSYDRNGYGNYVVIRHFNGLETIYGHMSKRLVNDDDYVYTGMPIGLGGSTGRSTGPHLHLETRFCGIPIDPRKIFNFTFQDVTGDIFNFK